jgi:hypothetical protein
MENEEFDHIKHGKALKHYVYPPAKLPDVDGFEDGLLEVIPEKLEGLLNRCKILKKDRDQQFSLIKEKTKPGSIAEYFYSNFASYDFTEYYVIQKWINYWLSLWYKITKRPIPTKFGKALNSFDELELERARQKPITELFDGQLKKSGARFVGLCPFHNEKTPSFYIFPDNQFHCFGCNAHGDSISFIQKTKNLSFPEAVRFLL